MRRISLAVLILPVLAIDPTLAMGGGGAGAGGAGAGGAGNGAPTNLKRNVVIPPASAQAYGHPTSDTVKDPLLVESRHPRSGLLERPARQ